MDGLWGRWGDDKVEDAKEKLSGDNCRVTDSTDGQRSWGEVEVVLLAGAGA